MGELWLNGISYSGGGGADVEITGEASGAIASFSDGSANPLADLKIAINPVQAGSGDPSPSNPRPISGWTGAEIHVADGETPHIVDNTYNVTWQTEAGTVYGGELDVTSGVLTVDWVCQTLKGTENIRQAVGYHFFTIPSSYSHPTGSAGLGITSLFKMAVTGGSGGDTIAVSNNANYFWFWADPASEWYDNPTKFKEFLADQYSQGQPLQICYPISTPTTISLTPTQVSSLLGNNNIWADSGDVDVVYVRDIDKAFNILWDAVMNSNSGTRSLNLMKGAISETKEDIEEPIKEEEETKEGKDENQR